MRKFPREPAFGFSKKRLEGLKTLGDIEKKEVIVAASNEVVEAVVLKGSWFSRHWFAPFLFERRANHLWRNFYAMIATRLLTLCW